MYSLQCPIIPHDLGVYDDVPLPVKDMAIQDQAQRLHNVDEAQYNEIPPAPAVSITWLCSIGILSDNG